MGQRYTLNTPDQKQEAETLAEEIAYLMFRINQNDTTALCAQFSDFKRDGTPLPHKDSVYANLRGALGACLMLLGVPEADVDEMIFDFFGGSTFAQALAAYRVRN